MINRSAILVRPLKPYLDWAASLGDDDLLPSSDDDRTVYLVPAFEDDEQAEEVLSRVCETIFENELFGWHTDEAAWPEDRSLETFLSWFEVEMDSVVEDLCAVPIHDEE